MLENCKFLPGFDIFDLDENMVNNIIVNFF